MTPRHPPPSVPHNSIQKNPPCLPRNKPPKARRRLLDRLGRLSRLLQEPVQKWRRSRRLRMRTGLKARKVAGRSKKYSFFNISNELVLIRRIGRPRRPRNVTPPLGKLLPQLRSRKKRLPSRQSPSPSQKPQRNGHAESTVLSQVSTLPESTMHLMLWR